MTYHDTKLIPQCYESPWLITAYWEISEIKQFHCFGEFPSNLENLTTQIFFSISFITNYDNYFAAAITLAKRLLHGTFSYNYYN